MHSVLEDYFDNAATTPVDPAVREAMLPYLAEDCGNAHSLHSFGLRARAAVEKAREHVAALIGAEDPEEIVFTSGATESNNWVLRSFKKVAVSPFEHSSVREPAMTLGHDFLKNKAETPLPPDGDYDLVSVMRVNNEIGTSFDLSPFANGPQALHSDLTQALGKIPVDVKSLSINFGSFSGHKLYGPKGIGGLYVRSGEYLEPLLFGGEQENGLRPGTLNVPAIVGFGEAARIAKARQLADFETAQELRKTVLGELEGVSDLRVNGGRSVSPFILSLSFLGVEGETLVLELDQAGFATSSGAACSSRSTEPSHVLSALASEPGWLRGTIRISFGRYNKVEGANRLAQALRRAVGTLRSLKV